jgi:glycosyltransferase 2 family protein
MRSPPWIKAGGAKLIRRRKIHMLTRHKQWLQFTFFATTTTLLLYLAYRGTSFHIIYTSIIHSKLLWAVASLFFGLIALVLRAYRWKLLLKPLGFVPTLFHASCALAIGYLANLAFPRLGEIMRCGSLSTKDKVPFALVFGTVVTERIVDMISLFTCILLAALFESNRLGHFLINEIVLPIRDKLTLPVLIALFALLLFICFIYFLKRGKGSKQSSVIKRQLESFADGIRSIMKLQQPLLFIIASIGIWVLYFLSAFVCFFAFPETSHLGPSAALLLLVIGGIAMSAPVQGGIGAYHLLVSRGLLLYGLSQTSGLIFATLLHSSQMLMVIVVGSISLLWLFITRKKARTANSLKQNNQLVNE